MTELTAPRIALAVTTVGRPGIISLLRSAAESSSPPAAVVIADQSGGELPDAGSDFPFDVRVVPSSGGASTGRNDAVRALGDVAEVLAFPNDDSTFSPTCLAEVAAAFAGTDAPDAVACSLVETDGARFQLPLDGVPLDRKTVWRAIEPSMFVRRAAFESVSGFRESIGTGCGSPWQSGEGTDLLLRIMASGGRVVSLRSSHVLGPGERRDLNDDEIVAKHRRYNRGVGFVFRLHRYPARARIRTVVAPWLRAVQARQFTPLAVRIAAARSLGRIEGLLGRSYGRSFPPPTNYGS